MYDNGFYRFLKSGDLVKINTATRLMCQPGREVFSTDSSLSAEYILATVTTDY